MSEEFLTLDDVDVSNKIVLLRGDLNVPVQNGVVGDMTRLQRLLKTIQELKSKKAKIVVLSHFGRPKGKVDASMSLEQIVPVLSGLLNERVDFCNESIGEKAKAAIARLKSGGVLVLENTRFHKGEEENDAVLSKAFASLGDVFVNDAFSVTHRAHSSTEGIAHLLPSCCGRDMQNELEALAKALDKPVRPVVAIVGGSKVSTKLALLSNLTAKVNVLVLGGGMANTFIAAQGMAVGKSLYESDMLDTARKIMAESKNKGCTILLPSDVVVAGTFAANVPTETVTVEQIPADKMALDVGPKTVAAIQAALNEAKTIVWNGPLGAFEIPPFEKATMAVAKTVASLTSTGAVLSVAGGGDTVAAVNMAQVGNSLSYVSTAGGAFLEWLEGCALPGVEVLRKQRKPEARAANV